MMPSPQGQLALWAKDKVSIQNGINGYTGSLHMLDISPESMSNANAARLFTDSDLVAIFDSSLSNFTTHATVPVHIGDSQSATLISLNSDVVGDVNYPRTSFNLPKPITVLAGRDILNLGFFVQNNNSSDVTLLNAGRDIRDETIQNNDCTPSGSNCVAHLVSGPGLLKVMAGRDIDLGNQKGLLTNGNQSNPFLVDGGASIELTTAGVKTDYTSLNNYINTTLVDGPLTTNAIGAWISNFDTASSTEKNKYFFQMLVDASKYKNPNTQILDLTYFDGLVQAMFPKPASVGVGNLSSHSSQIKTEQGGSIDMFTPAGSIFAGLTMGAPIASPSNQGIFTVRGGDVNALVNRNFLVNQGRVFTLSGGDITLVSQYGNLEAGKGAKTALSAPPPLITFDSNGNIKVDVSNSISGSGIATLFTHLGQPASNVYAVAPRGYFDAGDAGVRSTGSVEINATTVRNADNIVATGTISNSQAPTVVAPAVAPVAAPATPATSNNEDVKKSLASANTSSNNNLSVELLGLGDASADNPNASVQTPSENSNSNQGSDKTQP